LNKIFKRVRSFSNTKIGKKEKFVFAKKRKDITNEIENWDLVVMSFFNLKIDLTCWFVVLPKISVKN